MGSGRQIEAAGGRGAVGAASLMTPAQPWTHFRTSLCWQPCHRHAPQALSPDQIPLKRFEAKWMRVCDAFVR